MTMKLISTILMAFLFITAPAFAQDQPSGDERQPLSTDEIVSMMQSKLGLTQDQVSAITPIIEKYSSKRDELRQSIEDGTTDRDSIRSQMKELREDEKQDLSQILSADQLKQWDQMQRHGRHGHHSPGGEPSGAGPGNGEGSSAPPESNS